MEGHFEEKLMDTDCSLQEVVQMVDWATKLTLSSLAVKAKMEA